jgi:uncharacterized protein
MRSVSRRDFVQAAGLGIATLGCRHGAIGASLSPDRTFEYGQPLRQLGYDQVEFEPGLPQSQLRETHDVLMELSDDSLLKPYRTRAGLAAPGCTLAGWYSSDEFGAETFGQWVSALSRYYAITHDEATREKVDRLVRGLGETLDSTGRIFNYGHNKPPAYLYDKLTCGLIDAHQFARSPIALQVLLRAATAVAPRLPGKAVDYLTPELGAAESYTIPENQFIAWQRGGDRRHLEMAQQYLHHGFFDPLARGENVLPARHAYSHVNALSSAAKAYLVLGDDTYLRAASNGFAFIAAQSFATGGWGPNESFIPAPASTDPDHPSPAIATLGDALAKSHWHFETPCGAYAHFKLTRYLLRISKDSQYGDSMERVMYNTVFGAKPLLPDGRAFYQSDYNYDGHKFYFEGYRGSIPSEWPCCSGTLPQIAADYRISAYFSDAEGVYVNLYIPSTLTWLQDGTRVSLAQVGSYPLDDIVSLTFTTSAASKFAVRLRIPAWARQPTISINGRRQSVTLKPGSFAILERQWHSGDRIELELPRQLELHAVDASHPDVVAVCWGPLVLMAVTEDTPRVTRRQLLAATRKGSHAAEWLVETPNAPLRLMPFWTIRDERYSVYLSVS